MKRSFFYISLLALIMSTSFVSCDDEVQPAIVESDIVGFVTDTQDTTLTASTQILEIIFSPAEKYKEILADAEWNIQDIYLWNNEIGDYDFSTNLAESEPDWIKVRKVQQSNKTILQVTIEKNESFGKRGISVCIGQKVHNVNYIGVFKIMQKGKEEEEGPFEVKVRYKGQIHRSMATLDENEHIVYEDANFAAFMEELAQRGGIEAIARENGIIDYYDNDDVEAGAAIRHMMEPINAFPAIEPRWSSFATRSDANPYRYMNANALAYCALFDDKGYKDTHIYQNFTSLTQFYDQERMQNIGLNDKVTSLAVAYNGNDSTICAVLTVWEDTDYNHGDNNRTKHRMNFVASYYSPTMGWRNLKQVPCLTGNDTWNDRISSISFHFGHYGSYLIPY